MGSFRTRLRVAEAETEERVGMITGTGAADPTKSEGLNGVTLTRTGAGTYRATFEGPAKKVWPGNPAFWATTLTDVDGWSVVFGSYDATNLRIDFTVLNEARAATDLPAATGLFLSFIVKQTSA